MSRLNGGGGRGGPSGDDRVEDDVDDEDVGVMERIPCTPGETELGVALILWSDEQC